MPLDSVAQPFNFYQDCIKKLCIFVKKRSFFVFAPGRARFFPYSTESTFYLPCLYHERVEKKDVKRLY